MAKEWEDAAELLDTARKLVTQAHNILARDDFSDAWLDELKDIDYSLFDYIAGFNKAWLWRTEC